MGIKEPLLMTEQQFEFIANLIGARGLSRKGCKLMLVNNIRECDAAKRLNVSPTLLAVSVRKYREVFKGIKENFVN